MTRAASRAEKALDTSAELVEKLIRSKINDDGGFADRKGQSDLYYTLFGIETLLALKSDMPADKILSYLTGFKDGKSLDLIHLASLVRCLAEVSEKLLKTNKDNFIKYLNTFRCNDGGYSNTPLSSKGTMYGCFLVLGAYQDLGEPVPDIDSFINCINSLRTPDGGFANDSRAKVSSTPVTAAAITALHYLQADLDTSAANWLESCLYPKGGFLAVPKALAPDLLSTATAVHALCLTGHDIGNIKEICLDFTDSVWSSKGGFHGTWADNVLDCEYTYYGLLTIGHLSN